MISIRRFAALNHRWSIQLLRHLLCHRWLQPLRSLLNHRWLSRLRRSRIETTLLLFTTAKVSQNFLTILGNGNKNYVIARGNACVSVYNLILVGSRFFIQQHEESSRV